MSGNSGQLPWQLKREQLFGNSELFKGEDRRVTLSRKTEKNEALPKGWQEIHLGEIMEFKNGLNTEKGNYGKGIKFVNVMDIFRSNCLYSCDVIGSVQASENQRVEYSVKYGDVLFNRTSETPEEIAMASVYLDKKEIIFGGFVIRARQKHTTLIPEYSAYCFQSPTVRKELIRRGQGVVRANIGQKDLSNVPVIIPPINEQKAIASLLKTWDTAIEKAEALIAAKEKQFKWLLKTLISDQQDNSEWRKVKLEKLGVIHSGGTPSTRDSSNWNGDIFWLTPSEVTKLSEKYIYSTERQITPKGLSSTTLLPKNCLIVCTRATIGDCCINTVPMAINQGFKCIHPHKDYSVTFLYYAFQLLKAQLVRVSCGNTFGEVSRKDFANILISIPSLFEQKAIAAYLDTAQQEIITLKQLAEQYRTQKRGLMQKLLTGKWRIQIGDS